MDRVKTDEIAGLFNEIVENIKKIFENAYKCKIRVEFKISIEDRTEPPKEG
jgi:hypothetical protein